jgi:polyisoprenoid-binding protein YceI
MTETTLTTPQTLTTWKIDPSHSNVEFGVRHLMISTVKGRFTDVSGSVQGDLADPTSGKVDITIGLASIDTREAQRDAHLRSGDFFDVEKFPSMTFRSTRIEGRGDSFKVIGDLAIRGVSRPVVLDVTAEGLGKDPWGGDRAGFSATAKIKRSDFGLTWNQLLETGGVAVGDEIKISIDVELVKQQ